MAGFALIAVAMITERILEARDVARYTPGQSFASVGNSRIRYRLTGTDHAGATVVIFAGINGSIEQDEPLQNTLANAVPVLTYDRAGYGFSEGSTAHTAVEQADELVGLLEALKIEQPVVLVGYSMSAGVARVFAGRHPDKTLAMYLIDPPMPELDDRVKELHNTRRYYARFVLHQLVASSIGWLRLLQHLHDWQGPDSLVEQRANAVLVRTPHYWAVTREWWKSLVSARQVIEAPVPPALPLEIVYPKRIPLDGTTLDATSIAMTQAYVELVGRSSRGKLEEIDYVDHWQLILRGAGFEHIVERITQISRSGASQ